MSSFPHDYSFDPSYGLSLDSLLSIAPPTEPEGFAEFWCARYQKALTIAPEPIVCQPRRMFGFNVFDLRYRSTDGFDIGGWMLKPTEGEIRRGVVVGHGYGGRDGPDFDLPVSDAVFLFPCFRGLSRSRRPPISADPYWHVLHDIDQRDRYILGGCVEDCWLAVSALLELFPQVEGNVSYIGISFGGGIGSMAIP